MSPTLCALCDSAITAQNDSREHIIPNAIGGRKKIRRFICKRCNNESGRKWDDELTRQLSPLCLLLSIRRDSGKIRPHVFDTTTGEQVLLHADGRMTPARTRHTKNEADQTRRIVARTEDEAKKLIKKLKSRHPDAKVTVSETSEHFPGLIGFTLSPGGLTAGRSIVKSSLSIAVESGVNPKDCENARDYLLNERGEPCFGYYYGPDLVVDRPDIPFHFVCVAGDPQTKQLLGYVELFGFHRMVVCLSEDYSGPELTNGYAVNPLDGTELPLTANLSLTKQNIRDAYDYKIFDDRVYSMAIDRLMAIASQRSFEKAREGVVDAAVEHATRNCGTIDDQTDIFEHLERFQRRVLGVLEPFIMHHHVRYFGADKPGDEIAKLLNLLAQRAEPYIHDTVSRVRNRSNIG